MKRTKIFLREHSTECALIAVTVVLFFLLTYPLVFSFHKALIGTLLSTAGDQFLFYWNYWWIRFAILDLHTNPFLTDWVFLPYTNVLVMHTLMPLQGILSLPFQLLHLPIPLIMNTFLLLSFVIGALGMYKTVFLLSRDRAASFAAALLFTFSPIILNRLPGHYAFTIIWYVPWVLYHTIALFSNPSQWKKRGVWIGALLAAALYHDPSITLYLLLFIFVLLIFVTAQGRLRELIKPFILAGAISLVAALPMLITVRGRALEMRPPSVSEYLAFSPSLVSYILPASDHRLFGTELKNEITDRSRENDTFLGYAFLLLIALAAASWRFTQTDRTPLVRFLWIVFFLTIVLSFGAALRGRTEYYALGMGSNIENIFAPYVLFRYIPYYSQLHVPSRILLLAVPIGAILAGWGFVRFTERFRISRKQSWGIVVGMSVLLFVDNFRMPLDLVQPPQASPWLTELQKMDGDFAVFELPVYVHERDLSTFDTFDLNTFQTIHEKRTMNGYLSRAPRKIFMDLNAPGIRYLAIRDETTEDDRNRDLVMPFFWERNMRYALMYKTYFSKDEQEQLDSYLRSVLEFPVEFEDELLRVYTIPSVSP